MKNLRLVAVSLMAVLFGLTALSMWPDRRFAPPLPYRPALYAGWPTIEHCEATPFSPLLPGEHPPMVVSICGDLLHEHNGLLDFDLNGDGKSDRRLIAVGTAITAFELSSGLPTPIDPGLLHRDLEDERARRFAR